MTMPDGAPKYWFPAKKYGWGWGLPTAWQGWIVILAFIALLSSGAFAISPEEHPLGYVIYCAALTAALIAICYAKGEPPSWRWGK